MNIEAMYKKKYSALIERLQESEMESFAEKLPQLITQGFSVKRYGDLPRWQDAMEELPALSIESIDLMQSAITIQARLTEENQKLLKNILMKFHPWRKGPFDIGGVYIDTEWRSDFKWDRLKKRIQPLLGKKVLDVGCGSGYHCWRMAGEGADLVIGIDPTPLFVLQFWVLQFYIKNPNVWVVPARMEQLPTDIKAFDTVFSMGVLYHRRSPFDHLLELKNALVKGGQLVLETLVIEGERGQVLVPGERYGKMGNVWFLPSVDELHFWLLKAGFVNIEPMDINKTTIEEQRSTEWMTFQSLKDFLDKDDVNKTVEGYPAPLRAIFTATKK